MRFCQKRRVYVMLVFFIVFVTSVVNQIFAQQVININTDVNHNICGDSNISQNEVSSVSKNPVNNRVNINGGMAKVSFAFLNYLYRFLGISIEKFEKEKTGRFGKVFTMSQKDCFNKSLKIIKELRARVTRKSLKKGYIIAFDFAKSFLDYCLDSTEAGIFIADEGSNRVKVEVISNNSLLAKDFSVKFFEMLEQK